MAPVLGCFHSIVPVARPSKLATVLGACRPNRFTLIAPWLVCRVATDVGDVISPLCQKSHSLTLARLIGVKGSNDNRD